MGKFDGWRDWSPTPVATPKRRSKYNAEPTTVAGHTFPSKREADYYRLLEARLHAGEIQALELQPRFALHVVRPDGVKVEVGVYRADFKHIEVADGRVVYTDAKGVRTEAYQMRKRHVEAEYGVTIVEV